MSVADKLRQRRLELGMTRAQLAAKVCVTPSAIANYENAVSIPKTDILISLISALGVDANYVYSDYLPNGRVGEIYDQPLSQAEVEAIRKYKLLTEEGKRLVRLIVGEEYSRLTAQEWVVLPCYLPGMRKLHTGFLMEEKTRSVRIKRSELPEETEFCFQIRLDRYRPVFRNMDILALERREAGHNEIGLFRLNGVYYIRILCQENGERRLRALNVADPDILVRDEDQFLCLGKVLDKVEGVLEETD